MFRSSYLAAWILNTAATLVITVFPPAAAVFTDFFPSSSLLPAALAVAIQMVFWLLTAPGFVPSGAGAALPAATLKRQTFYAFLLSLWLLSAGLILSLALVSRITPFSLPTLGKFIGIGLASGAFALALAQWFPRFYYPLQLLLNLFLPFSGWLFAQFASMLTGTSVSTGYELVFLQYGSVFHTAASIGTSADYFGNFITVMFAGIGTIFFCRHYSAPSS